MKIVRYVCTHCGKQFEAKEKEIVECPGCFWSTSVKKADELENEQTGKPKEGPAPFRPSRPKLEIRWGVWFARIFPWAGLLAGVYLVFGVLGPCMGRWIHEKKQERAVAKSAVVPPPKEKQPLSPEAALAALGAGDKAVLYRRLQLGPDRTLSAAEKSVLDSRAPFQTGYAASLPSQTWTLENYKEMIAEQERFYKVPLPHSYKKKLETLFKEKYIPGREAFEAGNWVEARDFWAESLAFPIYGGDLQKHRGVVLTMLRVFVNDTLSKIGAINAVLVEKSVRDKERLFNEDYERLIEALRAEKWEEGTALIGSLENQLKSLENPDQAAEPPPPYPTALQQVDTDIQRTLYGLLNPVPPTLADFGPIKEDLKQKKKILEGLDPEKLAAVQAVYDDALDLIRQAEWSAAEEKLKTVEYPAALVEDAGEKIEILKRLEKSGA